MIEEGSQHIHCNDLSIVQRDSNSPLRIKPRRLSVGDDDIAVHDDYEEDKQAGFGPHHIRAYSKRISNNGDGVTSRSDDGGARFGGNKLMVGGMSEDDEEMMGEH